MKGQTEAWDLIQLLLVGVRKSYVERDVSWCWSNEVPMGLVWVGLVTAWSNSGLGKATAEMLLWQRWGVWLGLFILSLFKQNCEYHFTSSANSHYLSPAVLSRFW